MQKFLKHGEPGMPHWGKRIPMREKKQGKTITKKLTTEMQIESNDPKGLKIAPSKARGG